MDEKLLGKCGFYCGCCPTYIKGGCKGCVHEHSEGDCYTRDCVLEQGIACCGVCEQFPCDTIMTKPHTTVLDKDWLRWKKESNSNRKEKYMKDWIFRTDEYICDLRTVGILVRDGKLLVQRDRDGSEYALPGGHVKIGETTADGLVREYKEETGADIKVGKLLWTEECFWEWNGTQAHNIAFYYLIELADGSDIPDTGEFVSHKDNCNVVLGWMPIEKLADLTIYPNFVKEQIHNLDAAIQHFVTRA